MRKPNAADVNRAARRREGMSWREWFGFGVAAVAVLALVNAVLGDWRRG